MTNIWTISRATGFGVTAGLIALLIWPVYAALQERVVWAFVAALAFAAFCGVSIVLMTLRDMYRRRRGAVMQRIRIFDVLLGLVLAVPSLLQLEAMFGL
jgi:succinate dehydrogenase/fumarate reductase cytochrome b subunit